MNMMQYEKKNPIFNPFVSFCNQLFSAAIFSHSSGKGLFLYFFHCSILHKYIFSLTSPSASIIFGLFNHGHHETKANQIANE